GDSALCLADNKRKSRNILFFDEMMIFPGDLKQSRDTYFFINISTLHTYRQRAKRCRPSPLSRELCTALSNGNVVIPAKAGIQCYQMLTGFRVEPGMTGGGIFQRSRLKVARLLEGGFFAPPMPFFS
ncbi:MAG: hypothetical protein KBG13_04085, partial [Syntrophaceae bacterium]|nr:hypothetical protein [Syntrophaceae bacterium]